MASTPHPQHHLVRAVVGARATFTELNDMVWSLNAAESVDTLFELTRLEAQVAALKLQVLAQVDVNGAAAEAGASSTANWYAAQANVTRAQASREVRLAKALGEHWPVSEALQRGALHVDQAAAVITAVDQLPDDVVAERCEEAEIHLLAEAKRFDAKSLRILGKHLVEVVAPEVAEAHTARLLEAEERAAAVDETFRMWEDTQGRWHGKFVLDRLHGSMLKKALLAFAAPKHQAASAPLGERRPSPERLGQAFGELIESYPADRLPDAGGLNAAAVVTMHLSTLEGGDKPASLDTGGEISASLARKLACEAGLIPVVLGRNGVPVDVGRKSRLFTPAQRIALGVRDKGCTAEGCDWPPGMCHAHHDLPWSHDGPTDLDNGRLLCPFHHARAHDTKYEMRKAPGNRVGFYRRE